MTSYELYLIERDKRRAILDKLRSKLQKIGATESVLYNLSTYINRIGEEGLISITKKVAEAKGDGFGFIGEYSHKSTLGCSEKDKPLTENNANDLIECRRIYRVFYNKKHDILVYDTSTTRIRRTPEQSPESSLDILVKNQGLYIYVYESRISCGVKNIEGINDLDYINPSMAKIVLDFTIKHIKENGAGALKTKTAIIVASHTSWFFSNNENKMRKLFKKAGFKFSKSEMNYNSNNEIEVITV